MPTWKRILLKSFGVGVGIGIGLGVVVGFYIWHSSRPVPQKVGFKGDNGDLPHSRHKRDDSLGFSYILENHTNQDYRMKTLDLHLSAVLGERGTLTSDDVKFVEDAIFLPAKDHAQVGIVLPSYRYAGVKQPPDTAPGDEHKKYHDAVKKYVDEKLPRLDGFAAFDDASRYRINFLNRWHTP
jgi:hypothetical protein